ncbi:MAG: Ig-like domain repeat protein [Betaproteobacteria bacterium]|nr:Ig-like domain repeat protein [Betaproteobacteria bacterium]
MESRLTLHSRIIALLRRLSLCALAVMLMPAFAAAQSVISPPIAQVFGGGTVYAIVRQGDGKVIIGGSFTFVNGVARSNIARINSDGGLDLAWNPDADSTVNALVLDGAGNVLVGGAFGSIGGLTRNGLAKIALTGSGPADAAWNPNPGSGVTALALDTSGANVYVGGSFTAIGGQARTFLAKVSTGGTGPADATWNPNPDSVGLGDGTSGVTAVVADASGNVFVAGSFSHIGGQGRIALAKLSGSGTGAADPAWDPHPMLSGHLPWHVGPIALDPISGSLYVGGYFNQVGGQFRVNLAKLSPSGTGAADPAWSPNPGGQVSALAADASGNVYVSGLFGAIGGLQRAWMARVSGTGSGAADAIWNPLQHWSGHQLIPGFFTSTPGSAFAFDASGNVFAGGTFTSIGGQTKTGFAHLSASGSGAADPAWASAMVIGTVAAIARDGTGRTVIGGSFQFMGDGLTVRNNLARLDAAGNLDAAWAPEPNNPVNALALDGSGNVYAGGQFTVVGGQPRQFIARLAATGAGAADPAWNPNADGMIGALAFDQANGTLYAGGAFANIGGQARASLAKIPAAGTGAADPTWNPNPTVGLVAFPITALALDGSGKLYTGGTFTNVGGQPRNNIARLATSGTGAADAGWNPNADAAVAAFALDTGGSVYVGGSFSNIGGLARTGIARLSIATGLADPVWNPSGFGVGAIALDGSGHVYAAGGFLGSNFAFSGTHFSIGGSLRSHVARLSTSGAGAADCTWIADADGTVNALALDAGGNAYLGGNFGHVAGTARNGYAVVGPGPSPGCRAAITKVNAGVSPSVNSPFPVVVQSQDSTGLPQNVATDTGVTLTLHTGTGALGGTLACQISAGTDSCTLSAVTYSAVESGVVLTVSRSSGDTLAAGDSAPLTIVAAQPPSRLVFTDVNSGASPIAGTAFPVTVQARDASGNPVNVVADTSVSFALNAGTGRLTFAGVPFLDQVAATCTIASGANSCTLSVLIYSREESGVILTAFAVYAAGVIAGNSAPFTVADPANSRVLTVLPAGSTVTSNPPGIDCNPSVSHVCRAAFPTGTMVTLTYGGTPGSFGSWGGDCSGTAVTCSLTLNNDKLASMNVTSTALSSTSTTASATQATTTIVGNQTLRIDQVRTRIVGRYQGVAVYDQTFNGTLTDPAVQGAMVTAADAVRAAAASPSLQTTLPALIGTADTVLSTAVAFGDVVTALPVAITATGVIGPATVAVGALGNCVLAPTNCAGPYSTLAVTPGGLDIHVLIVNITHTDRTVVTTDTHALTSTYQIDDNPVAATVTDTALISSPNPSTAGQPVTFTATLTGGASPTGNVQFKDSATNLGPPVPLSGTTAALTTAALSAGPHAITATYSGDATNGRSTSLAVNQLVNAGPMPNCVAPPTGLISWWPGDGNANDLRGGNNGTLQGSATFAAGNVLQAFSFAANGYVDIPYGANLTTSHVTVEAWVNPATQQGGAAIANRRTVANTTGYTLEQRFDNSGLVPGMWWSGVSTAVVVQHCAAAAHVDACRRHLQWHYGPALFQWRRGRQHGGSGFHRSGGGSCADRAQHRYRRPVRRLDRRSRDLQPRPVASGTRRHHRRRGIRTVQGADRYRRRRPCRRPYGWADDPALPVRTDRQFAHQFRRQRRGHAQFAGGHPGLLGADSRGARR